MIHGKERRLAPRTASLFPLRYRLLPVEESGYFYARGENLSLEGVRFRSLEEVRVRTGLIFELLIPGAPPVRSFGRAAWVRELADDSGFEVGGRFVDLSTSARKALERHLGRELARTGP